MAVARVHEIACTPVKGCQLRHPAAARVTTDGIEDDRRFFLVDPDERMLDARVPGLKPVIADYDREQERLHVRLPGGEVDEVVRRGGPLAGHVTWDGLRPVPGHEVLGGFSEAFSDCLGRPVRLVERREDASAIDCDAITIVSLASVAGLEAAMDGTRLGARRFRMSLTVDGCDAHAEDAWFGQRIDVGDCRLRIAGPVARCASVTFHATTGVRDAAVLKGIIRHRGRLVGPPGAEVVAAFGVYAAVERAGRVAVGDRITLAG